MSPKSIPGTYELKSFLIASNEGDVSEWGKNQHGLLIYTDSGHMSVSINKDVEQDPSQTECENNFDSVLFYSGTYRVEGNIIRHQVTEASNPFRIGKEMIRFAEWVGSELHLTTPQETFGKATLIWKRI